MIAGLTMYDRAETRAANDRFWTFISTALQDFSVDAPVSLTRDMDEWDLWRDPDLVLGQTCGLPYRAALSDAVNLVASPVWDFDIRPGYYRSVIVMRADRTGARWAVNDGMSQSGWAAGVEWAKFAGVDVSDRFKSGSHLASARAVAERRADICAIDMVTWAMIQRWDGFAKDLIAIDTTRPTPGLPYITARTQDPNPIFDALTAATIALSSNDKSDLCINSVVQLKKSAYLAEKLPPDFE